MDLADRLLPFLKKALFRSTLAMLYFQRLAFWLIGFLSLSWRCQPGRRQAEGLDLGKRWVFVKSPQEAHVGTPSDLVQKEPPWTLEQPTGTEGWARLLRPTGHTS